MAKFVDIIDTTFASSYKATLGSALVDKNIFELARYASKVGITNFETAGFNGFEDIVKTKKHLAFNYMYDFRKLLGQEANLSTLINATTLLDNKCVSSEFFKKHAQLLNKYNITTVRVFDNLNSISNIDEASYIYKEYGVAVEIVILLKERYSIEYYQNILNNLIDSAIEFETIVYIDNFGACTPDFVYSVVSLTKELLGEYVYVGLRVNDSLGLAIADYLAALEAGVDMLDCAVYPFSGGFASPDLLSLLYATKELEYNLGDLSIDNITLYQKELSSVVKSLELKPILKAPNSNNFTTPFPAKELQKYNKQITTKAIEDKITTEIAYILKLLKLKNVSKPLSEHIFNQAMLNITKGRWKIVDSNFATLLAKSTIVLDAQIAKVLNVMVKEKQFNNNIDEYLTKNALELNDENRFIFNMFGFKEQKPAKLKEEISVKKKIFGDVNEYSVEVGNKKFLVKIRDLKEEIEVVDYNSNINSTIIKSDFAGRVMSVNVAVGSQIIEGELLMTIWSGEKTHEVVSKIEGIVYNIYTKEGEEIEKNANLLAVEL